MIPLSVSRIKVFEECRRKFKYQYIDLLPVQDKSYFVLGRFVHRIIERYIRNIWCEQDSHIALKDATRQAYEEFSISSAMMQEVRPWLKWFLAYEQALNTTPLYLEKDFSFSLNDEFLLRGIIDRIDQAQDGTISLIDYKTSRNTNYLDQFQLITYAAALRHGPYPTEPLNAWYVMVRLKFQEYPQSRIAITDEMIDVALQRIYDIGEQIRDEQDWPVTRTSQCQRCDFFRKCFTELPSDKWTW